MASVAFFLRDSDRLSEDLEFVMPHTETPGKEWDPHLEQHILQALKHVRYGSVEIIIHDSKVVQIERKEKIRFSSERPRNKK
jgi:hypothetical protein